MKSFSLEELTESFVQLDEVRLHTVSLGPDDGELVICSTGFLSTGTHGAISCHSWLLEGTRLLQLI